MMWDRNISNRKRIDHEKEIMKKNWASEVDRYFKTQFSFYYYCWISSRINSKLLNKYYLFLCQLHFYTNGIGTNAAFSSIILLSSVKVIFTFVLMNLIEWAGKRPLMRLGTASISLSLLWSFGFNQTSYKLTLQVISQFKFKNALNRIPIADKIHKNNVTLNKKWKTF